MTATADLPNKNILDFTAKTSFVSWDKSLIIDSEDWNKLKLISYDFLKGDTWAKITEVAFVWDDMVFTLDDATTVTLTDAKIDLKWDQWIQWETWAKITSAAFVWNNLVFTLDDASTVTIVDAKLDLKWDTGVAWTNWIDWTDWDDWVWITSITKTWTVWLVDTYTILYTDSTTSTFDITNWKDWTNWTNGTDGKDGTDWISFTPRWAYNAWTAYVANDVVSYLGSSWTALQNTTGNIPTEWANWTLLAAKGTDWMWAWDVIWPATNTDSYIPQRDWVNTKTLKNWLAVPQGWLAGLTALWNKVEKNAPIAGATKTKITYDAKWLVIDWEDATTADIADSTDKRYVTDAQLTVIGNTSWINTGDQDLSWLASKTNVLELDNTDAFTPTADYHPATKKYVDDNVGGGW
jgi:hypothetical protein